MENIKKKFVKLIYLISRVFFAWTFLIFWPALKDKQKADQNVNKPAKVSICLTQGCIPRSYRLLRTTISEL